MHQQIFSRPSIPVNLLSESKITVPNHHHAQLSWQLPPKRSQSQAREPFEKW